MIQSSDLSSTQSYLYKAKKGETFAMIKNFILKFLRLKKGKKSIKKNIPTQPFTFL